jgi:hypothetical protein
MRRAPPRQQSGELLYFLSGFLSLQLEIQNFFALYTSTGKEDAILLPEKVLKMQRTSMLRPFERASTIAKGLLGATSSQLVREAITNSTSKVI